MIPPNWKQAKDLPVKYFGERRINIASTQGIGTWQQNWVDFGPWNQLGQAPNTLCCMGMKKPPQLSHITEFMDMPFLKRQTLGGRIFAGSPGEEEAVTWGKLLKLFHSWPSFTWENFLYVFMYLLKICDLQCCQWWFHAYIIPTQHSSSKYQVPASLHQDSSQPPPQTQFYCLWSFVLPL